MLFRELLNRIASHVQALCNYPNGMTTISSQLLHYQHFPYFGWLPGGQVNAMSAIELAKVN